MDLIQAKGARRVLLSGGAILDELALAERLRGLGIEVWQPDEHATYQGLEPLFAGDVGITGAEYLIAETGSIVVASRPDHPRAMSLLPPVHITVARATQIVPDLFDLFDLEKWGTPPALPSCLAIITGPSKTGDIELRLVTGVHGPGEVHVVLIG
jgi:L-lactate utilization protein LutC